MRRSSTLSIKLFLIVVCISPLLSGCWDRQEIEERAVALGIGIDQAEPDAQKQEGEISHLRGTLPAPRTGMIRVTVQIAVPGRIPLGPGGGGGGGGAAGGGGQNTVWVVEGVGHTIDDAFNNIQQRISSPLFFGHLRIIVVSETLARKGIRNLNEYFRRNPEIRRMTWMLISKGKAEALMKASPQLERVPTLYLLSTLDQSVKIGRFPNDFLGMFWSASSAKGQEGFLPYAALKSEDTVEISGLAFFRDDKLVGVTKPLEIPLYMGITGLNPAGGQAFVQLPGTSEYILFGARTRKSVIQPEMKNGKPIMKINIFLEGNILEKSNDQVELNSKIIKETEQELAKRATKAYEDLIKKTQEQGSDIFGFGELVRAKKWQYWNREIKTKKNWQNMYKELSFEVSVQTRIRRVGMKAK